MTALCHNNGFVVLGGEQQAENKLQSSQKLPVCPKRTSVITRRSMNAFILIRIPRIFKKKRCYCENAEHRPSDYDDLKDTVEH